ncbi:hypothetical protein [uncultured Aurantimicrobium sp.]|uniref:hypothetical protein n=1 Tax=uncultured Aurantimicrobium sp. TaxID=1705357 RepID=UPI00260CB02E|nr:hypothetical protein [uncultured Aurantimicrobium sp.]
MSTLNASRISRPQVRPQMATKPSARTSATAAPQRGSAPTIQGNLALKARTSLNKATAWRPSIQVVATRAQRKARPRVFYAIITVGVIFGIIISNLLLSVAVASGAYEIAAMQQSNKELGRSYQTMNQDLDRLSSPQNLAANAEALGMVNNSTPVYLRLSDGAVLGTPEPASATSGLIAGAEGAVPNSLLTGVTLVTQKESEAKAAAAKKAAAEAAKTAPVTDSAPAAVVPAGPVALTNGLPGVATR